SAKTGGVPDCFGEPVVSTPETGEACRARPKNWFGGRHEPHFRFRVGGEWKAGDAWICDGPRTSWRRVPSRASTEHHHEADEHPHAKRMISTIGGMFELASLADECDVQHVSVPLAVDADQ